MTLAVNPSVASIGTPESLPSEIAATVVLEESSMSSTRGLTYWFAIELDPCNWWTSMVTRSMFLRWSEICPPVTCSTLMSAYFARPNASTDGSLSCGSIAVQQNGHRSERARSTARQYRHRFSRLLDT